MGRGGGCSGACWGRATSAFLVLGEDLQKVPQPRGRKQLESQAPGEGWGAGGNNTLLTVATLTPQRLGPTRLALDKGRRRGSLQGAAQPQSNFPDQGQSPQPPRPGLQWGRTQARGLDHPGRPRPWGEEAAGPQQLWSLETLFRALLTAQVLGSCLEGGRGREGGMGSEVWGSSTEVRKEERTV